ncbi:MAG: DNRLRE domain-containing protein, partial [Chloroflexi bacterium]|nr:DNRLRE domain-containing protein [Chloroflexota bacterium]
YGRGDGDPETTPWAAIVIGTEEANGCFEIVNCTVDDVLGHNYLMYVQYDAPDTPVQLWLKNNIFRGAGPSSHIFVGRASQLATSHNLFYFPQSDLVLEHGNQLYSAADIGTLGTGNLYGDPLFILPAWGQDGDYHLQAGSPAINAGTADAAPPGDLEDNPRDAQPDMGAYEYGPTSATATPSPTPTCGEVRVVLQQGNGGYRGSEDTHIHQYAATTNYCTRNQLEVGYKQQYASLLHFDLSSIPAGAVVTQASLQLYAIGWSGSNLSLGAYAVLRDVELCQTTWNLARTGQSWAIPGCNGSTDRRGTPENSVTTSGIYQWYEFDITSLVQDWVYGDVANCGLLLRGTSATSTSSFRFASSESGTASQRPKLVVTYRCGGSPPATPSPTATGVVFTPTPTPTGTATRTATRTVTPTITRTPTPTCTPTSGSPPAVTPTAPCSMSTVTLQKGSAGYGGSEDTHIYQYAPNTNYCQRDLLEVGYKQQYAALLHFDLSTIPAQALIEQATLHLYAVGWSGSNLSLDLYAILRNTQPCQTTWNQAQAGSNWALPGANAATDRRSVPESSVTTSGIYQWYPFDITSLVQEWVEGSLPNNGMLLRGSSSLSTVTFRLASTQYATVSQRPKLVVTYRAGTGPVQTPSATVTGTRTTTATFTPTRTGTATATRTRTATPTPTQTPTRTRTPTRTGTPVSGDNPNPPASPVKLIFIHHSCGSNWLADSNGQLGITLRDNNYFVSNTNYGWGPDGIGNNTDIGHWWTWFVGPNRNTYTAALYSESGQNSSYSRLATNPGGENQIVMFKSCYPNSDLGGNPDDPPTTGENPLRGQGVGSYLTVANAKGIYNDLLTYFATRQDKLFIAITAPPLVQSSTDASAAANARAFNNWLVNDWLDSYPYDNVAVFDFYSVLTSNGGSTTTNDLGWSSGNHHRWWNAAIQHVQTVANNYSAYGSSAYDSHPTAAGNRKASAEFVQLLNVFYHRWADT